MSSQNSSGFAEAQSNMSGGRPKALNSRTASALQSIRQDAAAIVDRLLRGGPMPPFVGSDQPRKVFQLDADIVGDVSRWFVLGDIHGDFFAFYNSVEFIRQACPDFRLVFLGDLVDRAPHSLDCFWYILSLVERYPHRILWLAGNHDVAISYNEGEHMFRASVSPAEFVDELNARDRLSPFSVAAGKVFVKITDTLPRAILFPDGTLVTHGGVPLADLDPPTSAEETFAWLNSSAALQDFTWTRITRFPKRMPNRYSVGCSYGFKDFETFAARVADCFPAKRLVTGHEHPSGGVEEHPTWVTTPALTLAGFGFDHQYHIPEAYKDRYAAQLRVGRMRQDEIPEVLRFDVDRSDLVAYWNAEIAPRFGETSKAANEFSEQQGDGTSRSATDGGVA